LTEHNDLSVTISFRLLNKGYPYNFDSDSACINNLNVRQSNAYYKTDGRCWCSYPFYDYNGFSACNVYIGMACNGFGQSASWGGCTTFAGADNCCEHRYL
jgi:hypothetical protein